MTKKNKKTKKYTSKKIILDRSKWPIVAICYDFDKTLSPKNMQEYSFIPDLGMNETEFWGQNGKFSKENKVDQILSYMYMMIRKSEKGGDTFNNTITKTDLNKYGKSIELFPGVTTWFSQIEKIADGLCIKIEHYIISAGIKEMIEGSSIATKFEHIYASSFVFDKKFKYAIWPSQVINGTNKTQFIFRINKGCLNEIDEEGLNKSMAQEQRRIPFSHMIYIGDSETDIPCMTVVKRNGGYSIGVYNPEDITKGKSFELLRDNRINFFAPADYRKDKDLFTIVQLIFKKIFYEDKIGNVQQIQGKEVTEYFDMTKFNTVILMLNIKEAMDLKNMNELDGILSGKLENLYLEGAKFRLYKMATFSENYNHMLLNIFKEKYSDLFNEALQVLGKEKLKDERQSDCYLPD